MFCHIPLDKQGQLALVTSLESRSNITSLCPMLTTSNIQKDQTDGSHFLNIKRHRSIMKPHPVTCQYIIPLRYDHICYLQEKKSTNGASTMSLNQGGYQYRFACLSVGKLTDQQVKSYQNNRKFKTTTSNLHKRLFVTNKQQLQNFNKISIIENSWNA